MQEKIHVEFSSEQFEEIMRYMKLIEAPTVQCAIMNAISIAFDESEWQ